MRGNGGKHAFMVIPEIYSGKPQDKSYIVKLNVNEKTSFCLVDTGIAVILVQKELLPNAEEVKMTFTST